MNFCDIPLTCGLILGTVQDNNNNDDYICNAQFKQSSNAPLLHY